VEVRRSAARAPPPGRPGRPRLPAIDPCPRRLSKVSSVDRLGEEAVRSPPPSPSPGLPASRAPVTAMTVMSAVSGWLLICRAAPAGEDRQRQVIRTRSGLSFPAVRRPRAVARGQDFVPGRFEQHPDQDTDVRESSRTGFSPSDPARALSRSPGGLRRPVRAVGALPDDALGRLREDRLVGGRQFRAVTMNDREVPQGRILAQAIEDFEPSGAASSVEDHRARRSRRSSSSACAPPERYARGNPRHEFLLEEDAHVRVVVHDETCPFVAARPPGRGARSRPRSTGLTRCSTAPSENASARFLATDRMTNGIARVFGQLLQRAQRLPAVEVGIRT